MYLLSLCFRSITLGIGDGGANETITYHTYLLTIDF